jgi:predicted nucleic acid-binding protein
MANSPTSDAGHFVLDTSALLTLHQDEPGAVEVETVLAQAGQEHRVWICFISLMEFFYIIQQQASIEKARQSYAALKQLPLMVIEGDEELGLMAADIKANHRLSLADAWVGATAERLGAILIHKDPEFEQLKSRIKLQNLPYKTTKQ